MRKISFSLVGMATLSMVCLFASAQILTNKSGQDLAIGSILKPSTAPVSGNNILSGIHTRAVRYFMTTYPEVYNETWEIFKGGYVVKFFKESVEIKNCFDKKGNWLYSIRRYDESKLPKRTRAEIKSIYYDYTITQVQEINTVNDYGVLVYLIYTQLDSIYKIIRYCNGEIEELNY